MKRFCSLASGSKGNCHFLETSSVRLLIDAGISARGIGERLAELDVEMGSIDAILVSHEHSDHIRAVGTLARRHGIPVLANAETAKAVLESLNFRPQLKIFTTGERFEFADLVVYPFSVPHDAVDPVAFTLTAAERKIGICTDLGYATPAIRSALQGCHHLVLEANHEPEWVHASARPDHLKQRILGRSGHLSNQAAGALLQELIHDGLETIFLAHLSEECNSPELALKRVCETVAHKGLKVAPQRHRGEALIF